MSTEENVKNCWSTVTTTSVEDLTSRPILLHLWPLSPGLIYVHCIESQRRAILQYGSFIRRFVGNGTGGPKIIADSDMDEYIHQLDIRNEA